MSDPFAGRTLKRKNVKGLALNAAPARPVAPAESENNGFYGRENDNRTSQLEIGIEYQLDLKREDLEVVRELGSGNGGTVSKVRHIPTGTIMARKVIHVEAKKEVRRRIVRELHIMYECNSDFIVRFHGAFLSESNDVIMCMEHMDVGSLDRISQDFGPVRIDVLGKIAEATLGGLTYLYEKHHIMHRDIKPSNILVNSRGEIKLCDFGVSGELVNSIADTFVGTSTYMAPERIQGEKYTVKSDVWSFGLTIMELAIGKFPFDASEHLDDSGGAPAGILDLLQQIVHEPAPRLPPSDAFPPILDTMLQKCLMKDPDERPTPKQLFEKDHFVQAAKRTPVDLREWAVGMMEKHNRTSHLAPQLSPATQELLRSSDSPTAAASDSRTPTSGIIPIGGGDIAYQESAARSTRSPPASIGRAGGSGFPGMAPRGSTTSSIPRLANLSISDDGPVPQSSSRDREPSSSRGSNFESGYALPIRPAPAGPLPPPPVPRKEDDGRRENRRQATFGVPSHPSNGMYTNYTSGVNESYDGY